MFKNCCKLTISGSLFALFVNLSLGVSRFTISYKGWGILLLMSVGANLDWVILIEAELLARIVVHHFNNLNYNLKWFNNEYFHNSLMIITQIVYVYFLPYEISIYNLLGCYYLPELPFSLQFSQVQCFIFHDHHLHQYQLCSSSISSHRPCP